MAINISARPIILTIGSQDWSQWIDFEAGIQIGYPEYQLGSGLLVVSGSISLKFGENSLSILPSSPYYRFNVSQWKRGQTLSIRVDGSFIPCSGQQLFILKAPQSPKKDINGMQTLTLEIGCRLALNNFPPEPSRNIAGVVAGQPTNRSTIIQRILDYIAVPNSISPMPYDIDYPLPKTDGNWIQFAGKIADSAGYHLRCDNTGIVRNYPNNITVGANDFAYTIGSDEKLWQSIGDISEQPIERLIVTGVKQNVKPVEDLFNNPIVDEELGTFIEIAPDLPVSQQQPFTLTVKSSTTKRVEAKQSVSPIINSSVQRDLIIQEIEEKIEPLIAIAPNLPVSQNEPFLLTTSLIKTKTYFLLKGVVQALVEATDEPIIKIAPDLPVAQQQPFLLTASSITRSAWVKRDDGKWNKTVIIEKPFILLAPDLPVSQNEPFLLTIASQSTSVDTSGAPTSSSLGFEISENTIEEQQLTVDVFAAQLVDDPFRERQRTIDVPYASNEGQLFAYGSAYNKFLSGRAFGWQLGGTYRPIEPFSQVAVVDGNIIYYLKADAIQYAFNGTEAYVLLNGIEVGVASIGAPNTITPPVLIPLGSFSILGESIANIINSAIAFDNLIGMSYAQSTWVIPISFDPILGMSYAEINYRESIFFNSILGMTYAEILNEAAFAEITGMSYAEIKYNPLGFDNITGMSYATIIAPNIIISWRSITQAQWRSITQDQWRGIKQ